MALKRKMRTKVMVWRVLERLRVGGAAGAGPEGGV